MNTSKNHCILQVVHENTSTLDTTIPFLVQFKNETTAIDADSSPIWNLKYDSDYWVVFENLYFTTPMYSYLGWFNDQGLNNPIPIGQYTYTMNWIMPVQGYLSTALHTNSAFIANSVTMDSAFNMKVDGYAQSYQFTMTEYTIPDSVKQAANAPDSFSAQLVEVPNFPSRPGPNNDVYD